MTKAETWRLIMDGPGDGAWNMAVDSALLSLAEEGACAPILRFYSWTRPTLSIGRLQKIDGAIDLSYLADHGAPLVRRPTGGRALLHDDEVTYSVTLPAESRLYGPLNVVYSHIARAIRMALASLGMEPDPAPAEKGISYTTSEACFATRTGHEISINGRKVAASAQRRLRRSAMQHGSIILKVSPMALDCLVWPSHEARRKTWEGMAGLWDIRGANTQEREVKLAVIQAMAGLYGIEFESSTLTLGETALARRIMALEEIGQPEKAAT